MGAPVMGMLKREQRPLLAIWAALAALLASAYPVSAQVSWDGSDSTNWFTGANWNFGVPPSNAIHGTVDTTTNAPVIASSGASARALYIGAAGGTTGNLTVTGAGTLNVVGGASDYA